MMNSAAAVSSADGASQAASTPAVPVDLLKELTALNDKRTTSMRKTKC